MPNDYGEILSLTELCELLKISENVASRLVRTGQIQAFKIGRVWKIPRSSVYDYISHASSYSCKG